MNFKYNLDWIKTEDFDEKNKLMSLPMLEIGKERVLFKLANGFQFIQRGEPSFQVCLLNVFVDDQEYVIRVNGSVINSIANLIMAGYSPLGEYIISCNNEFSIEPAESQVAPERREREERIREREERLGAIRRHELDVVLSHFSKKQQIKLMSEYIKTEMSNCGDVFEDFMNIVEHEYPDKISEIDDALEDLYETC